MKKTMYFSQCLYGLAGVLLMLAVAALTRINCYVAGIFGMVGGLALYFAMVLTDPRRDYLQIRALFTGVWIVTISLCQMRFLGYQTLWLKKTWLCVIFAYASFQVGGILSRPLYGYLLKHRKKLKHRCQWIRPEFSKQGLFLFCTIGTLVSLVCFVINIAIRGYVPFFSAIPNAYLHFYTRFYVLCVAGTMLAGPCYYCIKTCKLKLWQQILLYACILYNVFGFPILVVSRGTFITAAISLSCAIYYLNKRRFWVLIVCLIVMFSVYFMCSNARNYSDAQLNEFFETDTSPKEDEEENEEDHLGEPEVQIQLPGQVAFVYSYLTVAHDNMNEAVKHCQSYSYGLRQLAPFNALLRSDALDQALDDLEYYLVRPHLNTINLMGEVYYDFGMVGMLVLPLLWALAFGLMQESYLRSRSGYGLLALGNAVAVVALCFFATWMSQFSTWLFWGVALLLFFASGVRISFKKKT